MRLWLSVFALMVALHGQEMAVVHLPAPSKVTPQREEYPGCENAFFKQSCGRLEIAMREKTQLSIEQPRTPSSEVAFRLKNTGGVPIEVPVDAGIVPLLDGESRYRQASLKLKIRANGKWTTIASVSVFGMKDIPGSLVSLHPGQWVTFRLAAICHEEGCFGSSVNPRLTGEWSEYEYAEKRERCLRELGAYSVRWLRTKEISLKPNEAVTLEGPQ